jgi:hypothetical protein
MSGFFKIINNEEVDITTLFQEEGISSTDFFGLVIPDSKKEAGTAYARPTEFGYKIKDSNDNITDLSEYCNMSPTVYVCDDTFNIYNQTNNEITVDVSNCNAMSGYIVSGAGGGGGGSGGVVDDDFWSDTHYKGGTGGVGTGGHVLWFADYDLNGVNDINISLGKRGNGGAGSVGLRLHNNGWGIPGSGGNAGDNTEIFKGTGINQSFDPKIKADGNAGGDPGGAGGGGGNRAGTGSSGNTGTSIWPRRREESTTHTNGNIVDAFTQLSTHWDASYKYVPIFNNSNAIKVSGNGDAGESITDNPVRNHHGTIGGGGGNQGGNYADGGGDGGVGESGYAVLYLKR